MNPKIFIVSLPFIITIAFAAGFLTEKTLLQKKIVEQKGMLDFLSALPASPEVLSNPLMKKSLQASVAGIVTDISDFNISVARDLENITVGITSQTAVIKTVEGGRTERLSLQDVKKGDNVILMVTFIDGEAEAQYINLF